MKAVIYAPDMRPLKIVELDKSARHYILQTGRVNISLPPPLLSVAPHRGEFDAEKEHFRYVTIMAEKVHRYSTNEDFLLLFSADEDEVMLLP